MAAYYERYCKHWTSDELDLFEWCWKNSFLADWQISERLKRPIEALRSMAYKMGWFRQHDAVLSARAKLAWQYDDPDWIDEEDLEAWKRLGEPKTKLRRISE